MKALAFLVLLAAVVAVVRSYPYLWELGVAAVIGGTYWIFFRQPPSG